MTESSPAGAARQALGAGDRARLSATLALAAADGGAVDTERLAALMAAERILARHGLHLRDLPSLPPEPYHESQRGIWRETCRRLAERPERLRQWERGFVSDLPRFGRLSTKQRYALAEIARRVLGEGGDS